jgi:hypothetical protein
LEKEARRGPVSALNWADVPVLSVFVESALSWVGVRREKSREDTTSQKESATKENRYFAIAEASNRT